MSFSPRSFAEIRDDMLNYIRIQTQLTDYEIGSKIRSLVEAAALEDDEQYFQMVALLDSFNIKNAFGSDLDRRAADYDLDRLQPGPSSGKITVLDNRLPTTSLSLTYLAGVTSLFVANTTKFPTGGFPYNVRLGEGTLYVEDVACSAINFTTNELTVAATLYDHSIEERVSYVSGAANQTIASGLQVQTSSKLSDSPTRFTSTEKGTLVNGNYYSTSINAKSVNSGTSGNIGTGVIKEYVGAAPFDGAGVTNLTRFSGGRDKEKDSELQERCQNHIQRLSNATVLALRESVKGVTDPVTLQSVVSSSVLEDFNLDEVIIYVDDGRGFTADFVQLPRTSFRPLLTGIGSPTVQAAVGGSAGFPSEGYLILSPESAQIELVKYTSVTYATDTFTLDAPTTTTHDISDEMVLVDALTISAEAGANFYKLQNSPILRNSYRFWLDSGAGHALIVDGTDYVLNRGTGDFKIIGGGLLAAAKLVGTYSYYTGLIASAQLVVNGDPNNPTVLGGVRAGGVQVVVETPAIRRISLRGSVSVQQGYNEDVIALQVQEAIETYISGLDIGTDVILAKATEVAMGVNGMADIIWNRTTNLIILENELPVPFDVNGNSLITIV